MAGSGGGLYAVAPGCQGHSDVPDVPEGTQQGGVQIWMSLEDGWTLGPGFGPLTGAPPSPGVP
jgi:hypothetical protein